jgi:hypothetical protein
MRHIHISTSLGAPSSRSADYRMVGQTPREINVEGPPLDWPDAMADKR